MQNQLESIKLELLASALGSGKEDSVPTVESASGTIMLNVSCSRMPEILLLLHGTAPAEQLGLGSQGIHHAITRCTAEKCFCKGHPSWTKAETLSSCSGA